MGFSAFVLSGVIKFEKKYINDVTDNRLLKRKKRSESRDMLLEDEQKYKQTSTVSIRHGIGDCLSIDGLNRRSTVTEVISRLTNKLQLDRHAEWTIIEKWRGTEKVLPARTRILRVWHAWCSEQVNVEFWLSKSKFNQSRQRNYESSSGRRKKKKESDWCDTDSMTSDSSSDSSFVDSLATSEFDSDQESLKGDNAERQQLIRLLESQSVAIQRNEKHASQLQTELDELDCLTLVESIELAERRVQGIEQKNAVVEMELAGFEDLIDQADQIAHYDDQAKRGCLHELISRQLILNKRLTDEMAQLAGEYNEVETQIASQTALLVEEVEGQDSLHVKTSRAKQLLLENVDADNESSDTEQQERLNSYDSWQSDSLCDQASSSSSDGGGDSGLPGDCSDDSGTDRTNRKDASDAGSINTSDSALSSMQDSDYTRYKTIKKKRLPDWWSGQADLDEIDPSNNHLAELRTNNLDLSCDDDAPFGNSEYIKKIRAKNAKMANLIDQHQVSNSASQGKVYRSASTRRRATPLDAQWQSSTTTLSLQQHAMTRLKRSQSLKTVETLV